MRLKPTDWHNCLRIRFELASNTQSFQLFVRKLLAFYVVHTRHVQLDDFGGEFMRPVSHVSHHANNDNLTKNERKLKKQTGLYSAVLTDRDD
jgi:hypothetical protein